MLQLDKHLRVCLLLVAVAFSCFGREPFYSNGLGGYGYGTTGHQDLFSPKKLALPSPPVIPPHATQAEKEKIISDWSRKVDEDYKKSVPPEQRKKLAISHLSSGYRYPSCETATVPYSTRLFEQADHYKIAKHLAGLSTEAIERLNELSYTKMIDYDPEDFLNLLQAGSEEDILIAYHFWSPKHHPFKLLEEKNNTSFNAKLGRYAIDKLEKLFFIEVKDLESIFGDFYEKNTARSLKEDWKSAGVYAHRDALLKEQHSGDAFLYRMEKENPGAWESAVNLKPEQGKHCHLTKAAQWVAPQHKLQLMRLIAQKSLGIPDKVVSETEAKATPANLLGWLPENVQKHFEPIKQTLSKLAPVATHAPNPKETPVNPTEPSPQDLQLFYQIRLKELLAQKAGLDAQVKAAQDPYSPTRPQMPDASLRNNVDEKISLLRNHLEQEWLENQKRAAEAQLKDKQLIAKHAAEEQVAKNKGQKYTPKSEGIEISLSPSDPVMAAIKNSNHYDENNFARLIADPTHTSQTQLRHYMKELRQLIDRAKAKPDSIGGDLEGRDKFGIDFGLSKVGSGCGWNIHSMISKYDPEFGYDAQYQGGAIEKYLPKLTDKELLDLDRMLIESNTWSVSEYTVPYLRPRIAAEIKKRNDANPLPSLLKLIPATNGVLDWDPLLKPEKQDENLRYQIFSALFNDVPIPAMHELNDPKAWWNWVENLNLNSYYWKSNRIDSCLQRTLLHGFLANAKKGLSEDPTSAEWEKTRFAELKAKKAEDDANRKQVLTNLNRMNLKIWEELNARGEHFEQTDGKTTTVVKGNIPKVTNPTALIGLTQAEKEDLLNTPDSHSGISNQQIIDSMKYPPHILAYLQRLQAQIKNAAIQEPEKKNAQKQIEKIINLTPEELLREFHYDAQNRKITAVIPQYKSSRTVSGQWMSDRVTINVNQTPISHLQAEGEKRIARLQGINAALAPSNPEKKEEKPKTFSEVFQAFEQLAREANPKDLKERLLTQPLPLNIKAETKASVLEIRDQKLAKLRDLMKLKSPTERQSIEIAILSHEVESIENVILADTHIFGNTPPSPGELAQRLHQVTPITLETIERRLAQKDAKTLAVDIPAMAEKIGNLPLHSLNEIGRMNPYFQKMLGTWAMQDKRIIASKYGCHAPQGEPGFVYDFDGKSYDTRSFDEIPWSRDIGSPYSDDPRNFGTQEAIQKARVAAEAERHNARIFIRNLFLKPHPSLLLNATRMNCYQGALFWESLQQDPAFAVLDKAVKDDFSGSRNSSLDALRDYLFIPKMAQGDDTYRGQRAKTVFEKLDAKAIHALTQSKAHMKTAFLELMKTLTPEEKKQLNLGNPTSPNVRAVQMLSFFLGAIEEIGLHESAPGVEESLGGHERFSPLALQKNLEANEAAKKQATPLRTDITQKLNQFLNEHGLTMPTSVETALLNSKNEHLSDETLTGLTILMEQFKNQPGHGAADILKSLTQLILVPSNENILPKIAVANQTVFKEVTLYEKEKKLKDRLLKHLTEKGGVKYETQEDGRLVPKLDEQATKDFDELVNKRFFALYQDEIAAAGNNEQLLQQIQDKRELIAVALEEELRLEASKDLFEAMIKLGQEKDPSLKFPPDSVHELERLLFAMGDAPIKTALIANLKRLAFLRDDKIEYDPKAPAMDHLSALATHYLLKSRTDRDLSQQDRPGLVPPCLKNAIREEMAALAKNPKQFLNSLASGDLSWEKFFELVQTEGTALIDASAVSRGALTGETLSYDIGKARETAEKEYKLRASFEIAPIQRELDLSQMELTQVEESLEMLNRLELDDLTKKQSLIDKQTAEKIRLQKQINSLMIQLARKSTQISGDMSLFQKRSTTLNTAEGERLVSELNSSEANWNNQMGRLASLYVEKCLQDAFPTENSEGVRTGEFFENYNNPLGSSEGSFNEALEQQVLRDWGSRQELFSRGKKIAEALTNLGTIPDPIVTKSVTQQWIDEASKFQISKENAEKMLDAWIKAGASKGKRNLAQVKKTIDEVESIAPSTGIQWNGIGWQIPRWHEVDALPTDVKIKLSAAFDKMAAISGGTNPFVEQEMKVRETHVDEHKLNPMFILEDDKTVVEAVPAPPEKALKGIPYEYKYHSIESKQKALKAALDKINRLETEYQQQRNWMMTSYDGLRRYKEWTKNFFGYSDYQNAYNRANAILSTELPAAIEELKKFGNVYLMEDPSRQYSEFVSKSAYEVTGMKTLNLMALNYDLLHHEQEVAKAAKAAMTEEGLMLAATIATAGVARYAHTAMMAGRTMQALLSVTRAISSATKLAYIGKVGTAVAQDAYRTHAYMWYYNNFYTKQYWDNAIAKGAGEFEIPSYLDLNQNKIPDEYETGVASVIPRDARDSLKGYIHSLKTFGGAHLLGSTGWASGLVRENLRGAVNFGIVSCGLSFVEEVQGGKSVDEALAACAKHGATGFAYGLPAYKFFGKFPGVSKMMERHPWTTFGVNYAGLSMIDLASFGSEWMSNEELRKSLPGAGGFASGLVDSMADSFVMNMMFSRGTKNQFLQEKMAAQNRKALAELNKSGGPENLEQLFLKIAKERAQQKLENESQQTNDLFLKKKKEPVVSQRDLQEVQAEFAQGLKAMPIEEVYKTFSEAQKASGKKIPIRDVEFLASAYHIPAEHVLEVMRRVIENTVTGRNKGNVMGHDGVSNLYEMRVEASKLMREEFERDYANPKTRDKAKERLARQLGVTMEFTPEHVSSFGIGPLKHTSKTNARTSQDGLTGFDLAKLAETLDFSSKKTADQVIANAIATRLNDRTWINRDPSGVNTKRFAKFLQHYKREQDNVYKVRVSFLAGLKDNAFVGELMLNDKLSPEGAAEVFGTREVFQTIKETIEKPENKNRPGAQKMKSYFEVRADALKFNSQLDALKKNPSDPQLNKDHMDFVAELLDRKPKSIAQLPISALNLNSTAHVALIESAATASGMQPEEIRLLITNIQKYKRNTNEYINTLGQVVEKVKADIQKAKSKK